MTYKQKLGYVILGSVLTLIGVGAGMIIKPLTAQNTPPKYAHFDNITCKRLDVFDDDRNVGISISAELLPAIYLSNGGVISLEGKNGKTSVDITCVGRNASVTLKGGYEGKNRIDLFTRYETSASNPDSLESRLFGISLTDLSKSKATRANMFISADGRGGFTAYGVNDKHLWGSSEY